VTRETVLPAEWIPRNEQQIHGGSIVVEVKIARVPVGAVLRQLKLYEEFIGLDGDTFPRPVAFVLATPYPVSGDDNATLEAAGITHVLLGKKFEEYVATRATADQVPSGSLEL
jgi:hypothetical protein